MVQRNILGTIGPRFNAAVVARAIANGGDGTYTANGTRYQGDGILVAIPEFGRVLFSDASASQIEEWLNETIVSITSRPAPFHRPRYFGAWIHEGLLFLDIVEAFPREDIHRAIVAGHDRNQIAIWDNGRQELIATGAVA